MVDFSFSVPLEDKDAPPALTVVPSSDDFEPKPAPPPAVTPDVTPQQQAESDALQRASGFPTDVKTKSKFEFNQKLQDISTKIEGLPVTQKAMSNPAFATKAQNSVEDIGMIEQLGNAIDKGRAIVQYGKLGTERRSESSPEILAKIEDLEKRMTFQGFETTGAFSYFTSAFEVVGQMAEMFSSARFLGITGAGVATGAAVGTAGGPGGAVAGAITGGSLASTGAMALEAYDVEGGAFYNEALTDGVDKDEAAVLSVGVGLINAALETVSFGVATKPFRLAARGLTKKAIKEVVMSDKVRGLVSTAIKQYGATIFTEVTTEVLQEIVNIVAEEIGKESSGKEATTDAEVAARLEEIAVKTFKAMVVLAPVGPGANLVVERQNAKKAKQNRDVVKKIKETSDNSELGQVDPTAAARHVSDVLKDAGHPQIYIPGDQLQAWVDIIGDVDMVENLGVADQLEEAIFQGNDVSINSDTFTTLIMGNESFDLIEDHIRYGQNSKTAFEAEEGEQALQDEVREFDTEKQGVETITGFESAVARSEDGQIFRGQDHHQAATKAREAGVGGTLQTDLFITTKGRIVGRKEASDILGDDHKAVKRAASRQDQGQLDAKDLSDISQAEKSVAVDSFFTSADQAGWTAGQWVKHNKNKEDNRNEAIKKQEDKVLRDEQKKLSKEWKKEAEQVRQEVEESLNQEQVYQAFNGIGLKRLNKQEVMDVVEGMGLKIGDLPVQARGRKIYNTSKKEPSIGIDVHAGLYGYETGAEMITDFYTSPHFNEAVKNETNRVMEERHSELADRNKALEEARLSLLEADYGSVLMEEVNALRAMRKEKKMSIAMVKRMAKARIGEYRVKDITPGKFMAAMRTNGRKAGVALRKGNIEEALAFKFKQTMNQYMAVEANRVRSKLVENRVREMRKGTRFKKKGEKLPVLYQEALSEFMTNINIRPKLSPKKIEKLTLLSQRQDARANIPLRLLAEDAKTHYRDMTLDEFTEMYETYKDIRQKGLTENKMMREAEQQSRDEIVAGMAENIRANLDPLKAGQDQTRWEKVKEKGSHALSLLYNADTLTLLLDGGQPLGRVYQATKGAYDRALSEGYHPGQVGYLRRSKQVAKDILELYKVYTKKERKGFSKKLAIPGTSKKLTRQEIISVLLNSGNQQNIDAMLEGKQFTQEELDAVHAFADKRDWDFAQSVWDYLDTFWPEVAAAEKRRRNYSPRRVEAKSISTQHGVYKGGYYPLRYDKKDNLLPKSEDVQVLHDQAVYGSWISQHTARGHTESRTGSGGQRVLLDMFVLNSHIDQVIYDLEVGDAVTDIWKVLSHKETKAAFEDTSHTHKFDWMELWVRDVTTDQIFRNNLVERSLRWLRTGYTVSKLGWNVGVGLLQPLGMLQSSVALGHQNMFWALGAVLSSKQFGENSIYAFVKSETGFMDSRATNWNKDISEAQRQLKFTILDQITPGNVGQFVRDSLFWMIKSAQGFTDTVTWLAAKKKGMADFNGDEVLARRFADRAVAGSQASGIFGERTNIERGSYDKKVGQTELIRGFSVFISYFMAKTNVAIRRTSETSLRSPAQMLRWSRDMMMLYTVEALLAALITNRLPDDEDEEPFVKTAAVETVSVLMSGVPFLREISGEVQGFRGGGVPSAISRDFGRVFSQLEDAEVDEQLVMASNNLLGVLFHYPAAQINKSLRAYIASRDGEEVKAVEWLLGPKFDK